MTPPPSKTETASHELASHESANHGAALSFKRWRRSAGFAWAGLAHTWRTQPNFRIECVAALLACLLCALLNVNAAPIVLTCALVLALEVLNTAIEALTDLVSPQYHPLAKVAKDAAAGAVLIASALSVIVGLCVFGPQVWAWLH